MKRGLLFIAGLYACCTLAACGSDAPAQMASDGGVDLALPEDLEGYLDYQMERGGIRGLAAAIVEDGVVVRTVVRGMADETHAVDEHTLFVAASVSKTFVGALLLQLAAEGELDLDAPLDEILGYPVRHPGFPDTPITTRMLMVHTSGLIDDFGVLGMNTISGGVDPTTTLDDFVRAYIAVPSHFAAAPGTTYAYTNAGFAVLARVVEVASGADFRALSQERLFAPLMLDGAGWFYADVDANRLAVEYVWTSSTRTFVPEPMRNYSYYPATSLRISITGLTRWMLMHINGGELDGVRTLDAPSLLATQTVVNEEVREDQALVWYYTTHSGRRWLSHSGSSFGASNQLLYDPESGRGIALLTNSDAYVRARLGLRQGTVALEAILDRLNAEADSL